jgi:HEPN domain-containing protein
VVREAQGVVELALKGRIRGCGSDVPRGHDVTTPLPQGVRFPEAPWQHLDEPAATSRTLRRDRASAWSGTEGLTPSEFDRQSDASAARTAAQRAVALASKR